MARNTILRTRYSVFATVGLEQALTLLTRASFDLVLVGQLYSTDEKHAIVDKAHDVGAKALCIYTESSPPDVPADAFISSEDGADHLLTAVAALLG
jgi:hypothetical protein